MSTCHSRGFPKYKGEQRVHNQLLGIDDNDLFFWSSLDFIPGVNDIDLLLWHKKEGVFIVEIKAVSIEQIKSFSYHSIEIIGRGLHRSPQRQAYDAFESLRNFIGQKKLPFIVSTVCWPMISRITWKDRFNSNKQIADLADSMIMEEDIHSGARILSSRLNYVWSNPPIRSGSDRKFDHDKNKATFELLKEGIDPECQNQVRDSDKSKVDLLEKSISTNLRRKFHPFDKTLSIFNGGPGTGKTFRLQQIALIHAYEGASILFCCFNKVLAAEIKRIFHIHGQLENQPLIKENIEIIDINSLFQRIKHDFSLNEDEDILSNCDFSKYPKFDTILVDEAQDLTINQIKVLRMLSKDEATVVFSNGKGQEIYKDRDFNSKEIEKLFNLKSNASDIKQNFRNSKPVFDLANIVYECDFNEDQLDKYFEQANSIRFFKEIEFVIEHLKVPKIINVDDSSLDIEQEKYTQKRNENLVSEYYKIIDQYLDVAQLDILILTPDREGIDTQIVREVLELIKKRKKIDYVDYTIEENRSTISKKNTLRFCTYHSSKGLEADTVIVFGFDKIKNICDRLDIKSNYLGYIALSRAITDLVIVSRNSLKNFIIAFLIKAQSRLIKFYE